MGWASALAVTCICLAVLCFMSLYKPRKRYSRKNNRMLATAGTRIPK